jgi:hypothetical protein
VMAAAVVRTAKPAAKISERVPRSEKCTGVP